MTFRSQQDETMPSVFETNNLKKAIIYIRLCEVPLQIHAQSTSLMATILSKITPQNRVTKERREKKRKERAHITAPPAAWCSPRIQTPREARKVETYDGPDTGNEDKEQLVVTIRKLADSEGALRVTSKNNSQNNFKEVLDYALRRELSEQITE